MGDQLIEALIFIKGCWTFSLFWLAKRCLCTTRRSKYSLLWSLPNLVPESDWFQECFEYQSLPMVVRRSLTSSVSQNNVNWFSRESLSTVSSWWNRKRTNFSQLMYQLSFGIAVPNRMLRTPHSDHNQQRFLGHQQYASEGRGAVTSMAPTQHTGYAWLPLASQSFIQCLKCMLLGRQKISLMSGTTGLQSLL